MNYWTLIAGRADLAEKVVKFFTAKVTNPDLFRRIQDFRAKDALIAKHVHDLQFLINLEMFTIWDFMMFESDYAQKNGIPNALVDTVLQLMVEKRVLFLDSMVQRGQRAYSVNDAYVRFLADRDCLDDTIFGFQFMAEKYKDSIFKVAIEDQKGDRHIGTGFLMSVPVGSVECSIVLTNDHVVQNAKSVRVLRRTNETVPHLKIVTSTADDLAAIELAEVQNQPPFCIGNDPSTLDEVISMGYPKLATARDTYLVTHRGEINGFIQGQQNRRRILFSAKTGPGNSGGPLINENGFVVGAIAEDLVFQDATGPEDATEQKYSTGQLPYHAAIPSAAVVEFLINEYPDLTSP